jgi:fatty-acyl-CoA synthase
MTVPDITLAGWMSRRCARTPQRPALTYESETWTYEQLSARIAACAEHLVAQGVEPGDRVAYLDLNNATFFVTLFATSQIGAVFVPLNFRLTGPELAYIVSDAGARVMVAGREYRAIIDEIRESLPCVAFIAADEEQDGWQALAEEPQGTPLPSVRTDPSDVAIIMYTSGTTGRPKGAMLTHANLWWNNINCLHAFDVLAVDVTLIVMPIFHIGALATLGLLTLQKGGHAVLMRSFEPQPVLDVLVEYGATTMMAVPTAFQALADLEGFDQADLSKLRLLICGGSPCPVDLMRTYLSRDLVMVQGWGMTEAAPVATFLTDDFALSKVGSAGAAVLLTDVRLVSPAGEVIEESHVQGEAHVRGPNIMKGYWNNPDETAASLSPGGIVPHRGRRLPRRRRVLLHRRSREGHDPLRR